MKHKLEIKIKYYYQPKNYGTVYTNKHILYITERRRNTKIEKEQIFSKY
jgi:hypothetical protein